MIGNLHACGGEQIRALAELAQEAFGNASQWDAATYGEVGVVAGEFRCCTFDGSTRKFVSGLKHHC